MVDAGELVKRNDSIEYLAEPYIFVTSGRRSIVNLSYAINLIAWEKDYRITDFSVSEFFAYVIMEKKFSKDKQKMNEGMTQLQDYKV